MIRMVSVATIASAVYGAISIQDAIELLNGRGPATLTYSSSVKLDDLLTNFASCDNKCVGKTPCGITSSIPLGGMCTATATSNNNIHCLHGYVCCDPTTCRAKTQNKCTYGAAQVMSNLVASNFKSALYYLNMLGGSSAEFSTQVEVYDNTSLTSINSERCASLCNGWTDIWSCPSSCQCTQVVVPELVVGETYRCVASSPGASGYAAPISKFGNGTVLCPAGYRCADVDSATPCMSSSSQYSPSNGNSKSTNTSYNSDTTAIAVGSACGAIGLLGACYFFSRKKKQPDQPVDEDHYHEAPNGA